ncbi:unnamed protein product [Schistosoma margrebowiei]|uniref:Uncharacterized protein n=1 Tax=Schistosoma margrebowiei TaxID=48269 RepID=A0A183M5Y6_9TREM|nr:unnamed protein product [Schistosoma margrebowiei]
MAAGNQRLVHTPFVPAGYWSPCAPLVYRDTNSTTVNLSSDYTSKPQSDVDSSGGNQRSGLQSNISSSTRLLLDEQEKYHRSNRLLDEHLAAASTIRAALRAQRFALRTASTGLSNLSSRFPQPGDQQHYPNEMKNILPGTIPSFQSLREKIRSNYSKDNLQIFWKITK